MRRIYESDALKRNDDEPLTPRERDDPPAPQAMRSVPSGWLSRLFVPMSLRYRAISVAIETPESTYEPGDSIPFRVTMKNSLPIPVTIPTASPILWTWAVNGDRSASRIPITEPDDEPRGFHFDRGQRIHLSKEWDGMFRISRSEWEYAEPGTYILSAGINTADADSKDLVARTEVTIADQ